MSCDSALPGYICKFLLELLSFRRDKALDFPPLISSGVNVTGGRVVFASFRNDLPSTRISDDRETNRCRCSGVKLIPDLAKSRQKMRAVWYASGLSVLTIVGSASTLLRTCLWVRRAGSEYKVLIHLR